MIRNILQSLSILLLLFSNTQSYINIKVTRLFNKLENRHIHYMETVGSPTPQPQSRPKAFIISPSTQTGRDELLILQNFNQIQSGEMKKIGIIGTQSISENHSQMVELLAYALILSGNHVYTSGGGGPKGTNIAVIRGALRACNPDLLTVILPQSLFQQPVELQPLLLRVANLIEQPDKDAIDLKTAATLCNDMILSKVLM